MSLYSLINDVEELNAKLLSDNEAEVQEAYDSMVLCDEKIDELLPWYAKLSKNLEAEAEMYKAEADRLAKMAKSRSNAVERIKQAIYDAMMVTGRDKVKTDIGTYSLQKNPPSVEITSLDKIPESYLIPQEPKVDKRGIIQAYKMTGEIIPGTEIKQEMGLRFR